MIGWQQWCSSSSSWKPAPWNLLSFCSLLEIPHRVLSPGYIPFRRWRKVKSHFFYKKDEFKRWNYFWVDPFWVSVYRQANTKSQILSPIEEKAENSPNTPKIHQVYPFPWTKNHYFDNVFVLIERLIYIWCIRGWFCYNKVILVTCLYVFITYLK